LDYIGTYSDDCDIFFESSLSGGEQSTLSGIVSAHYGESLLSLSEAVAGENLGITKAVYISATDEVKLAKADSEDTLPCMGFTRETVSSGERAVVQTNDILGGFTGLTPAAEYYLSQTTAGEITTVKPSWGAIVSVGVAKNPTEMDVHLLRIPNIFGNEYAYEESVEESSTTSTGWQEKLDINISNVPAGGYKILWSFEWSFSRTTGPGSSFGIHINWGAITLSETEMTPNQTYGDGAYYQSSGFGKADLSSGNHKIALNFHSGGSSSTTYIRRAKLEIWRVS
jgi:hypothetical protein